MLAAAGVPASALASLSPAAESPIAIGGGGRTGNGGLVGLSAFRRRRANPGSPDFAPGRQGPQGVAKPHPDWTITSIDITPEPIGRKDSSPAGTDLPLRTVITLETLYVGNSAPASGPGAQH